METAVPAAVSAAEEGLELAQPVHDLTELPEMLDTAEPNQEAAIHIYQYHIVFHLSYGVPVLMFQARRAGAYACAHAY